VRGGGKGCNLFPERKKEKGRKVKAGGSGVYLPRRGNTVLLKKEKSPSCVGREREGEGTGQSIGRKKETFQSEGSNGRSVSEKEGYS